MLKFFLRSLALPLCLFSQPAAAQFDGWTVITEAEDPEVVALAVHCPVFDQAAGRAVCLSLGCTPDEPFSFGFTFVGFEPPQGQDVLATLTVDGTEFPPVSMRLIGVGTETTVAAGYNDAAHAPLLDALRRKLRLQVRFEGDALPAQDMPLNSSLVSIDRAKALCAQSAAVPATTIIGQRLEIVEMLRGDAGDDHVMDVLEDGTLRVTLNGAESLGTWTQSAESGLCFAWPGDAAPICGTPTLQGRQVTLRLTGADETLAKRIEGTLIGPVPASGL